MTNIIIIDDDEDLRKMLRLVLEREKYEVLEASNGREGIDLCSKCQPDIIITDIYMPEKEGIETIIECKSSYPDVKIIAMSGGSFGKPKETLLKMAKTLSGIQHTFSKPFEMNEMLEKVKALV